MPDTEDAVTRFLNVDLDIRGDACDIHDFLKPIEASIIVLHHGGQDASFELADQFVSLEETLLGLIELVRALGPNHRRIWERLHSRKLNVGVQAASEPHEAEFAISAKTIELMAALHFQIVFTVYAPTKT